MPSKDLTTSELEFLAALVRMSMRKHQKAIDRFKLKPGQTQEDAEEVLERWEGSQHFRRRVLAKVEYLQSRGREMAS